MPAAGLPEAFVARMRELLGPEAPAFLDGYRRPAQRAVRANPLKLDPADLPGLLGIDPDPVPWCPEAFFLPPGARVGDTLAHAAGLCYVQEPSALAVGAALDVRPGQRVLDLAAAPGGKATLVAGRLGGRGVVVGNEVQRGRVQALADNLDRWGSGRTMLAGDTVARLAERLPGAFDRVLLDAPCSGEGLFRRNPAAAAQWRPGHVRGSAERQRALLADAAPLVRPGGVLVYSTCTFAPEENEQQVAGFLTTHPDWRLLEIPGHQGFAPGRPDWSPDGPPELARTVRLWPHHLRGEGHFVAKLGRPEARDNPTSRRQAPRRGSVAQPGREGWPLSTAPRGRGGRGGGQAVADAWRGFAADALDGDPGAVTVVGERAYRVADDELARAGVRLVRPGLLLGRARPGRFEPAHALAMLAGTPVARRVRRLEEDEAVAWVRGEALGHQGPGGWTVVTWNGWPLGWGRAAGGSLKNHYPKGLRTMRP
jgi:16S rRNA C967 or C1407 C5-methylase (RsmB/RsmF family)/NOL1/NOP2/fmu family ribosome biogenesis protein